MRYRFMPFLLVALVGCALFLTSAAPLANVAYGDGLRWDGGIDTSWYDPETDSFYLSTAGQLAGFAAVVNGVARVGDGTTALWAPDDFEGKSITLTADIDLAGLPWTPIGSLPIVVAGSDAYYNLYGNNSFVFNGAFDGAGYRIDNLLIPGAGNGVALFTAVGPRGSVCNLSVSGEVTGGYFVAGVVAVCAGKLENIVSLVSVAAANDCVGGVVADGAGSSVMIICCHNRGVVSTEASTKSTGRVGGVVGRVNYGVGATISRCSNTVAVVGYQYTGGIIGAQYGAADVEFCYNTGNITGTSFGKSYLGGIAGKCEGGTISNCYNTGDLYNAHWAAGHVRAMGGITGCEEGRPAGTTAVTNCYNTGAIDINTGNMVYGVHWIYEVGNISGGNSTTSYNTMLYENCFYLENSILFANTSHAGYLLWADIYKEDNLIWDTAHITGLTAGELRDPDFVDRIGPAFVADEGDINGGYPVLYWQTDAGYTEAEYAVSVTGFPERTAQISQSVNKAPAGQTVTITVADLAAGKQIRSVNATDAAGNTLPVLSEGNGVYAFVMPKRNVSVSVLFENMVAPGAAWYKLSLAGDLDAIWSIVAESSYSSGDMVQSGATVVVTVSKPADAVMTIMQGITVTAGGTGLSPEEYIIKRDAGGAGYYSVYFFTMPEADVFITPVIGYGLITVYTKTGATGPAAVRSFSRAEMLALARENLYFSGYISDTEAFIGKAGLAVTLSDLLAAAGLVMGAGSTLEVTSADGMNLYFSYDQLYGDQRYYYPNLISGATAPAKAAGRIPVDCLLMIKGYMAAASDGDVEAAVLDTLNAYRFVFGQTETEFNNGLPAVEYKVNSYMPKHVNALTLLQPEKSLLLGDVDGDGNVTASDATMALRAAAKTINLTADQRLAADADRDGKVTASDATMILRAVAKIIKLGTVDKN